MNKYNLTIVVLIFLVSTALITSAHPAILSSKSLSTQGSIDYNGHIGLPLLYSTDFEGVTGSGGSGYSDNPLNLGIRHCFEIAAGSFWIEGHSQNNGVTPHSGTRCLGQGVVLGALPERNEFTTYQYDRSYQTLLIQEWRYFPSSFSVPSGGWYEMFEFNDSNRVWQPFIGVTLWGTGTPGVYTLVLQGYDSIGGEHYYQTVRNWVLPLNQWFKFQVYVDRGTADNYDATAKVWFNDVLTLNYGSCIAQASSNSGDSLFINLAKMYTGSGMDTMMWTDDLEIYGQ